MKRPSVLRDNRGSADLVQFVLVLPIFVLLLYGSFAVWKLVSVKQSLGAAAYQAARCRSLRHGEYYGDSPPPDLVTGLEDDEYRCEWVLLHELADNSFIDWEDLPAAEIRYLDERGNVICMIPAAVVLSDAPLGSTCPADPTTSLGCNSKFGVEVELLLPWPIIIPGLASEEGEGARSPTLVARHRSYIECGPRWSPPTPAP